jgi:hypothetical protein
MRNLKRALSLALASVMLLGMMVVGTSATSINDFTDADEITQQEAVAITTGLGIFDGYDTGDFKPNNVVTRAEMAVIIAKILHGADVDPSNFAGAGKFTDVPEWAEGYVNLVAALNIIVGVGDNKFDPNATVTTAEASTMLLKALGYYTDPATQLGQDWKLEVTSKATTLGLYGDLSLGMNDGLTRENVAVLTFNALFAQLVAYDNNRVLYVKANDRNVVVTNGTKDETNTLAYSTFGLYSVEGVVVANGQTDYKLSETLKSAAQTTVQFTEETDLNRDGKNEYDEGDSYDFEMDTGLDMIGHAVKVYYKLEKKAPVVYALVDEATLVATLDYNQNTTTLANTANDAGFKKNTVLDVAVGDYIVNYDVDTTVQDLIDVLANNTTAYWSDGTSAIGANTNNVIDTAKNTSIPNGKKIVVISNSSNYAVDYVIVLDQVLTTVAEIDTDETPVEYTLTDADGKDFNVATAEVAEGDYVVATNIGLQDKVTVFYPATVLSATITKISGISNANADAKKITADGVVYEESSVYYNAVDNVTKFTAISSLATKNLILDEFGDLIGIAGEKSTPSYAYVAQYGVIHSTGTLNTKDALTAYIYFADGTKGVYEVDSAPFVINARDLTADEVELVKDADTDGVSFNAGNGYGVYTGSLSTQGGAALALANGCDGALGIWNVVKNDTTGRVTITYAKTTEETTGGGTLNNANASTDFANGDDVRLVKGHSTFIGSDGKAVAGSTQSWTSAPVSTKVSAATYDGALDTILYQNNDTVYFYVNGAYGTNGSSQTVDVITGIKNVVSFENDAAKPSNVTTASTSTGIQQVFATVGATATARTTVGAVLVEGIEVSTSGVYYYNTGNYHYTADGLVYELYDLSGTEVDVLYKNLSKSEADSLWDGFYTLGASNIVPYVVNTDNAGNGNYGKVVQVSAGVYNYEATSDSADNYVQAYKTGNVYTTYYVINDEAKYDSYVENLYTANDKVGTIADNVKVVDVCGSGIDSLSKLVRILKADQGGSVRIAYSFTSEDYVADTIYISKYEPSATTAPGSVGDVNYKAVITDVDTVSDPGVAAIEDVNITLADGKALSTKYITLTSIDKVVYTVSKDGTTINVTGDVSNLTGDGQGTNGPDKIPGLKVDSNDHTITITATVTCTFTTTDANGNNPTTSQQTITTDVYYLL